MTSRLLTFSPLEAEDWFKPYQVHSLFPTKYVKIPPKEKKQDWFVKIIYHKAALIDSGKEW